jgi:hypothetical protein
MRSTELHGERRSWNHHLVRWVVRSRRIFLEVWIFRNVRDRFQDFVTDHFTAATAKGKDGVAHQDHAGTWLVLMAYLVNPRLLDQFSRSQRAIALIKCFDVGVLQFHIVACFCFLSLSLRKARHAPGSNSANQKWDAFRVATSWSALDERRSFAIFLFRQPRAMRHTAALP